MKLVVLTGLVAVEKLQLAADLARHYVAAGETVAILDHVSRLPLSQSTLPTVVTSVRLEGDLSLTLAQHLREINREVVILAVSETVPPDALFVLLDRLSAEVPELEVQTLALVDTRTCDCFPTMREALEAYADVTLYLPFEWEEVMGVLA
ncbi:MAG: hypothetical protein K8L99_11845 [Anaerolineae bacterium]|nr:hypothetical protein [Anaerolineae bacterium]